MNYVNYNGTTTSVNDFGKTNFSKEGIYTGPGFEVVKGTSYPGEGRLTHSDMWIYGQNMQGDTPTSSSQFTSNELNNETTFGMSDKIQNVNLSWLDNVPPYDKTPYALLNETPSGNSGFYRNLVYPTSGEEYPGIYVSPDSINSSVAYLNRQQSYYHIYSNADMLSQLMFGWKGGSWSTDFYGVKPNLINMLYHDRPFQGATFTGGSGNVSATTYLNPPVTLQNYDSISSAGVVSQQIVTKAQNIQDAYFGSYSTHWLINLEHINQWAAASGIPNRWAFNGLYICWSLKKNLSDPKKWLMIPLCSRTDIAPNDWNCGINNRLSGNRVYSYIFFNYSDSYFNIAPIPATSEYGRVYSGSRTNSLLSSVSNFYLTGTTQPSASEIQSAGERVKQLFRDTIMNGLTIDGSKSYMNGASTQGPAYDNALIPFFCWNPFGYFWNMGIIGTNQLPGQPYQLPGQAGFTIDRRQDNGFRTYASVPLNHSVWAPQIK